MCGRVVLIGVVDKLRRLPVWKLLRLERPRGSDGCVRIGDVLSIVGDGVQCVPFGKLLLEFGAERSVGRMRGGDLYADFGGVELVKLFELLVRNVLVGGVERVLELRSGVLFVVVWDLGVHRVRVGHLLLGRVEWVHWLRRGNVRELDGRIVVRKLRCGNFLVSRCELVFELRGGDISSEQRRLELRGMRIRYRVSYHRSLRINGVCCVCLR